MEKVIILKIMFIVQSYSVFKVKITELKSTEISVWPVSSEPLNLFAFTRCGGVSVITVQTDLERDLVAFNMSQSQGGSDLQRQFAPHKSHTLWTAHASAARHGMLTAFLSLFAETQLHTEIHTCWTHKGAVISQVQSQRRVAGQFM